MKIWRAEQGHWLAESTYQDRQVLKAAGWWWDPTGQRCGVPKTWWTPHQDRAAKLAQWATDDCRAELEAVEAVRQEALVASRATDAAVDIPLPEGLELLPFQRAGVAYAAERSACLIGDEMGLGKTVQALALVNLHPEIQRVLIICPASLRLNWAREARKWLHRPMAVDVLTSTHVQPDLFAQLVVVNYDILAKAAPFLRQVEWDLLVVDEAHYCKNLDTKRAQQVLQLAWQCEEKAGRSGKSSLVPVAPRAKRRLFLTGTPVLNKPMELWPLLHLLDPVAWPKFWGFGLRYCAGFQGRWGWDFTGASNLDELQERLRSTIMVRRLKSEVLTELPAKRRQVIELEPNGATGLVQSGWDSYRQHQEALEALRYQVQLAKVSESEEEYRQAVDALREGVRVAFTEMARVRHEEAVAKLPLVISHLRDCLEDGHKVVVFAHHLDVLHALATEFGEQAVLLAGETSMVDRQAAVDRFQTDDSCRLFVGSIKAAGVGITLTAAAHVVFAELDWVPANLSQAEDRCHRIGQVDSVLVQHLVFQGSLDATMAQRVVEKQEVIDRALDKMPPVQEPLLPMGEAAGVSENSRREHLAREAEQLTTQELELVHLGLRMLAGMCDGAVVLDGRGFNRLDTMVGHSLARQERLTPRQAALGRRLVLKYHRQLPELAAQLKELREERDSAAPAV